MTPLLTRRQTLQSLAFSATFGGSLLGLIGCGGGHHGGGGGVSTQTAHIPVSLPSGFSIPASDLVGGTAFGTGAVDASGFTAKVNADAPTFAYLKQRSTGKVVMFGMVGAGRPGVTPLGAAAALMAFALGLTGLSPEAVSSGLAQLEARASVTSLAGAIEAAMASDAAVLAQTEDSPLAASIKAAYDDVSTPTGKASPRASSRAEKPLIRVTPDEQHSTRVEQGSEGTIVPTNLRRRPIAAYTYRTGHVPATTADAGVQLLDQQDIEPTTSLIGSLVTLGSDAAFAPRAGKEVALPVSGDDDQTLYETVVLYPSASFTDPDFFGDAKYAGELAAWKAKRGDLQEYSFVWGILVDIFKVATGAAGVAVAVADALSFSRQLAAFQTAAGQVPIQAALNGEFGVATQQAVKLAAQSDTLGEYLREALGRILVKAKVAQEGAVAGETLAAIASTAGLALAGSGALLTLADAKSTYNDLQGLPKGVLFSEVALQPKLKISPRTGEVRQNGSISLSADLVAISGVNATYTWTLTGSSYGTLTGAGGDGGSGKTITTTGTSVTFAVTPSDPEGQVATIAVEAKDKTTGKSLGSDAAKITVVGNKPVTEGATYRAQYFTDGESAHVSALVTFGEVKGATYYVIEGTGGNDPAYYHDHISLTYRADSPPDDGYGHPLPFTVGLSGIGGSAPGDAGGWTSYMDGRFGGFTFTATAYFS